ncbi:reverse transcriptase domain-containing protein [Tanacetum coccineum]
MGQIRLPVMVGNKEHSTIAWMNFMVIRSPSPYNGIIGRPGISAIRAVPSTAHGMLKFPVDGGIVTIYNTAAPLKECNTVTCDVTQTQRQHATKVTNLKVDIAGPFPVAAGGLKFLIVAIDYFTKWIEAKAVATITGNQVKRFVWDNIVCRFGLPGEIVSDNGKQFCDNPFGMCLNTHTFYL